MESPRVSGHELVAEGAAMERRRSLGGNMLDYRVHPRGVGGVGFGACSCGARSDVLDSGGKRKAWHRVHKAEIREGRA